MERQLTIGYTPQKNRVFERKNQTMIEMAKSMLHDKGLPKDFWTEAYIVVCLINRSPIKAMWNQTLIEAWSGKKPLVKYLKGFGSIFYSQIPKEKRYKLDEVSEKCIFVGYNSKFKGYKLFSLKTNKIIIIRDVLIYENASWNYNDGKIEKAAMF